MRILKWLLIIVAVLIAGIYIRNKAIGPEGWAFDNTERELMSRMKDPDSLEIRTHFVITRVNGNKSEIFICGQVDGKNSFGAYTGGTRFASRSTSNKDLGTFDTWSVQVEDEQETRKAREVNMLSSFEQVYWNDWCVDSKHAPVTVSGSLVGRVTDPR